MDRSNYWTRLQERKIGRRRLLAGGGAAAIGAAGLALLAAATTTTAAAAAVARSPARQLAPSTRRAWPAAPPRDARREGLLGGGTLRTGTFLSVLGIDRHIEVSVGLGTGPAKVYTFLGDFD